MKGKGIDPKACDPVKVFSKNDQPRGEFLIESSINDPVRLYI